MSLTIRKATAGDGAALHAMVRALADDHEQPCTSTAEDLEAALSAGNAVLGALLAFWEGEPAGCAIWHRSFSTFKGRPALYLEDLSVLPAFRRRGVARALVKALARFALAEGYASIYWMMMAWNEQARALYEGLGAEVEDGVCYCRLSGTSLAKTAA